MKTLIVEDDFTSRFLLLEFLKDFGPVHVAVTGIEAVDAVKTALDNKKPYNLICLDIMMPEMDGQEALKQIRLYEEKAGIFSTDGAKIVMTTALSDMKSIKEAFQNLCDGYLVKPIEKEKLIEEIKRMDLI